jgi:transposase
MSEDQAVMAPSGAEVSMVEPELIRRMRVLAEHGWGSKRIARELAVSRNTVRRYLRGGTAAETQTRPGGRKLDSDQAAQAVELFEGLAEGNAVVVADELRRQGVVASVRTIQRAVAWRRRERRAAELATVRFETAPGHQMQIDFGEKRIAIAGLVVRVHLLVAVLSYSRRLFVKAFLRERQDDWREGIAAAFRRFGGVPRTVLGDNARALVIDRDRTTGHVRFHPAYVQFCRDWDVEPRACGPYRARTKGKTESGVKYVKGNALAGRAFDSFAELEGHLAEWMIVADQRVHGTTREMPLARFERDEAPHLRPLPARPLAVRERSLRRKVAHDALVDVDTVRYSVPHRLVRESVEVLVREHEVLIRHGRDLVARHPRSSEPFARVIDPAHYDGLWRRDQAAVAAGQSTLSAYGRSLAEYAALVDGGGR